MRSRNTWDRVDLPILEWIADHPGARMLAPSVVADELSINDGEVVVAVTRLSDAGYMTGQRVFGGESGTILMPVLTERGLRATGVWPADDPYLDLIRRLDSAIAAASLPDDRTKLERVRDSLVDAGRDVGIGVLTAFVTGRLGI